MENNDIRFKYIFSDDYAPVYVNGAYGGLGVQGEVFVNFYTERFPLPREERQENSADQPKVTYSPDGFERTLIRQVQTGVVMDVAHAKLVYQWLGSIIRTAEEKAKNDGDISADGK